MSDQNIKYISLAEAAKLTNYSQDYISLLCRRRKMKGEKLGRNWFTTKEWIDDYINRTNGSGEIIIPVRVENASENAAKANDANQESADSFLLTKKLILATIIFSVFISMLVFLQQGVAEKLIANF